MTARIKNVNPTLAPKNMREITAFAVHNNLPHLIKMQGGYYYINANKQFQFFSRALYLFSFSDYYEIKNK